jgi:hypothetical protein
LTICLAPQGHPSCAGDACVPLQYLLPWWIVPVYVEWIVLTCSEKGLGWTLWQVWWCALYFFQAGWSSREFGASLVEWPSWEFGASLVMHHSLFSMYMYILYKLLLWRSTEPLNQSVILDCYSSAIPQHSSAQKPWHNIKRSAVH